MNINDMNIGDTICFGAVVPYCSATPIDLTWTKVSEDNLFMMNEGRQIRMQMDAKESSSASRTRRTRGCSFFPHTALFQWLNSSGNKWFTPTCDTDAAPDYENINGFLTLFSEFERQAMVEQNIAIVTPDGYKKDFGAKTSAGCLVSLPSYSQLFNIRDDVNESVYLHEGNRLSALSDYESRPKYAWTRSGRGGYVITSGNEYYDNCENAAPCDVYYVFPVIALRPDAEVEGFDRAYTMKAPDGASLSPVEDSELEKIWLE